MKTSRNWVGITKTQKNTYSPKKKKQRIKKLNTKIRESTTYFKTYVIRQLNPRSKALLDITEELGSIKKKKRFLFLSSPGYLNT